ncbi:hypothetical protein CCAX7_41650 [Capsulimonas corticalis]|uniref:General stress protein 17M-like domain-containing protein n=1 Tax=Capsulimonas corticalis TaxID=2219043 RepID=A0A402CY16_9BACT|nr:general stress protein [Capsulimonas corticalis]BDI32114.1 hypothetical protein CCAX7_41650 [Capsulimonas corticalis]
MSSTIANPSAISTAPDETVATLYSNHNAAEDAVRLLVEDGVPVRQISLIGRNFETVEDVQGFYRPADAALAGAEAGAWFGGFFGLMAGAMGFFVFPMFGAVTVLGPLAGLIAGAVGGAGFNALVNAMMAAGIPRYQALKFHDRLKSGDYLVIVHRPAETVTGFMIMDGETYQCTTPLPTSSE